MQRLAIQDIGPGFVHFPRGRDNGFTEEYFKQLTAEVFFRKYENRIFEVQDSIKSVSD